ncbi:MAG: c-type cytochrome [Dehalococcoidia bacterium]
MTTTRVPGSKHSRHPAGRGPGARLWLLALALALAMVALVGCRQGSYSLDFFQEMHYQQSYRNQEPPRLSPPEGSVPITGKPVVLSREETAALDNPIPLSPKVLEQGARLYQVNCSICHGAQGRGDGRVGDSLVQSGYTRPPDLAASTTVQRTDGGIFEIITNGVFVMPTFRNLLSEEERWVLVHYIRSTLQGRQ